MKSVGIVRKVDDLGCIALPKGLRLTMGISPHDPVEIFIDEECIILRKYGPTCIFCGEAKNVCSFKGKRICPQCLATLQEQFD